MTDGNSPRNKSGHVLVPIDPSKLGIKEQRLTNVPLINHLQECAEIDRLVFDEGFRIQCKVNRPDEPITALNFDWYGPARELLTILLQRLVLGTESFLSGAVLHELVQRDLVTEKTRKFIVNPSSLGGGTAEAFYNRLPGKIDAAYKLSVVKPTLWEEVRLFYKETRNPIFHGYLLNTADPVVLQPYIEMIRSVFSWIDTWYEDRVGSIMPVQIKKYWPKVNGA